ncbi:hypothetical protein JMG10_07830 [Nostoc ellipsosporum NOK]|nr:hypothetical protein [Nostoc ellipsosporum NOK]
MKTHVKKTNRFINVGNQLHIPVIFDIDFLSDDIKKITRGYVNFGGYYFKVIKSESGEYRVSETGVLFKKRCIANSIFNSLLRVTTQFQRNLTKLKKNLSIFT